MSEQPLAASLERLRLAHQEVAELGEADPLPEKVSAAPARALAARRLRRLGDQPAGRPVGFVEPTEPAAWAAAVQGQLPQIDDAVAGKARIGIKARTALAAVFALLALSGGIVSAHLLTATAQPVAIGGESVDEPASPTSDSGLPVSEGEAVSGEAPSAETVIVHIAGAVASPGIVELPAGSRVAQGVTAAGGATPEAELTAVNLARVLVDGEQIIIPAAGQAEAGPAEVAAAPQRDLSTEPDDSGLIHLNQAGTALLEQLPGIGPALAGRIVEYRDQIGGFTAVEQLEEVSGIGPAVMNDVRDKVAL